MKRLMYVEWRTIGVVSELSPEKRAVLEKERGEPVEEGKSYFIVRVSCPDAETFGTAWGDDENDVDYYRAERAVAARHVELCEPCQRGFDDIAVRVGRWPNGQQWTPEGVLEPEELLALSLRTAFPEVVITDPPGNEWLN